MSELQIQQINYRRRALLLAFIAAVLVYLLWNIPLFNFILYPVRLFVTYVHEAGHSAAALLTGGSVHGFAVSANGSGVAQTAGGSRALILPAGYLGSALFGSALFFIINRFPRWTQLVSFLTGVGLILFSLLFARTDGTGAPIALMVGSGFGVILLFMGWKINELINLIVLDVLAVMTALEAVKDVWFVAQNSHIGRGNILNDAAAFSQQIMPILPPVVVALIWAGIAVLLFGASIWYSVIRPLQSEINDSYQQAIMKSK